MTPQNGIPQDLESLLSKWKLECILSHLVAEKIDIDVLEMMKLSHIKLLLKNFPLGIQIRFEYYLEQWREEIGKPLQLSTNESKSQFLIKEYHDARSKIITKEMGSKASQTDLIIKSFKVDNNPITNSESNEDAIKSSTSCAADQKPLEIPPERLPSDVSSSRINCQRPKIQAAKSSIESSSSEIIPKLPTTQIEQLPKPQRPTDEVDLLTILKNASCGISLITSYGLRQTFTNAERKLLIDTIADYYYKNNLAFNIQISHALEQAVLKMFPSEKLSSYRTAKCGKIFISYIKAKAKNNMTKVQKVPEVSSKMVIDEDFEELYQVPDNHIIIQTENNVASVITDLSSHIAGFNDDSVSNNTEESIVLTIDHSDDETNAATKIGEVDISPTLDSATLICNMLSQKRQRLEEIDRPFINFSIPWDKVPHDVLCMLENRDHLGKSLNAFANLVIDELRKVSTHVPMRVLRAVSQQAVMKYPHSFLDKDYYGNLKPSTNTGLLSRLRNRNTFLNRQER